MRKLSVLFSLLMICFIFTGCSKEVRTQYTLSEIYSDEAYGFYIKDGETFYPLAQLAGGEGYLWKAGEVHYPIVSEKTPLVAVYNKNSDMPEEYYIEKFKSLGYTFGANVFIGDDMSSIWLSTNNMCPGSEMESIVQNSDVDKVMEIESINDQQPFDNIDTDINVMTGLEKNKYYDLSLYSGTRSLHTKVSADTEVFKSKGITILDSPLEKTHEKYFMVNLPSNITNGYYVLNGAGMFYKKD